MPPSRRIAFAAGIALSLGLSAIVVLQGFSPSTPLRALEIVAVMVVGAAAIGGAMLFAGLRLADWRDPATEEEFERLVLRSERLAREGLAAEPDEDEFLELDPYDDDDFEELVRDAPDEQPDLLRKELEHHVA